MTKSRGILRPRAEWTLPMLDSMRRRYPDELTATLANELGLTCAQVYQQAARMGLKKSEAFHSSAESGRLGHGKGKSTRFQKGLTPWNKGTEFKAGGRSIETQFKKGQMSGAAQHNYVPIGSLRVSKDGYLERKVTDDQNLVPTRRWTAVHRLVWEASNGPIPRGHIVRFKPGMKTTEADEITIDRLEMLTLQENMLRNSYHTNYPKEVAQLIQLRGAVQRKINRMEKKDD